VELGGGRAGGSPHPGLSSVQMVLTEFFLGVQLGLECLCVCLGGRGLGLEALTLCWETPPTPLPVGAGRRFKDETGFSGLAQLENWAVPGWVLPTSLEPAPAPAP
jgi:hypothetical protein